MSTKIAVAIVHGVGIQSSDFAEPMIKELTERFANELRVSHQEAAARLVIEPVHWAPVLTRGTNQCFGGG